MVNYECETCHAEFYMLSSFQKHMESIDACTKVLNKKFDCSSCDKKFTSEKSMKYHMKTKCVVPITNPSNEIEIIKDKLNQFETIKYELLNTKEQLKETKEKLVESVAQIEDLKIKIKKGPGRPKKITNNANTNTNYNHSNNTNNTNNTANIANNCNNTNNNVKNVFNFKFINLGGENLNRLTKKEKEWICSKSYGSLKECTKFVNCNPKFPEQRNVYVTNSKADVGHTIEDERLKLVDIDELMDDVILYRMGDLKMMLNSKDLKILDQHRERVGDLIRRIETNNPEQIKKIRKEIKLLIYNENKMDKDIKALK
jgi:hypothetical protein